MSGRKVRSPRVVRTAVADTLGMVGAANVCPVDLSRPAAQYLHTCNRCAYDRNMNDRLEDSIRAARELLTPPLPGDEVGLTELLTRVQEHIGAALDETMARAALSGVSVRTIASSASVAPNTVPPRLAHSAALAAYAEGGKVTAEGLAVARADRRQQQAAQQPNSPEPFTFTPRRRTP